MSNRIVTRGMGVTHGNPGEAGMITRGYGGKFIEVIIEAGRQLIRYGRSSGLRAQRELEEVIVRARLLTVNSKKAEVDISGFIRLAVSHVRKYAIVLAERVTSVTRGVYDKIVVTVKRIR